MIDYKGEKINKFGCRCEKKCDNNYCLCKKYNSKCSSICRCDNCLNNKIYIKKEEV